jgi:hypothetical protein
MIGIVFPPLPVKVTRRPKGRATIAPVVNLDVKRTNKQRQRARENAAAIRSIDARMDVLMVELADLELERRALERGETVPRRRR